MTERPGALRRTVLVACPGLALSSFAPADQALLLYMKNSKENSRQDEPVGIVISRGSRAEPAPIFRAFVWGPAPELAPVPQDTKAA
jgi:hypothetical protein